MPALIPTEREPTTGSATSPAQSRRTRLRWLVRLALLLEAAVLIVLALLHPAFRHAEGHLSGRACLPLAAGVALIIVAAAAGTKWSRPARWLALSIVGQAAALQLVRAGMMVGHQHYAPLPALFSAGYLPALLIIAAQTLIVAAALRGRISAWWRAATTLLPSWRLALVAAAFAITSATLSQRVTVYAGELGVATFVQLLNLITIVLLATSLPADLVPRLTARVEQLFGRHSSAPEPGGIDRFALLAAVWVLAVCTALAWFSYQAHPHVPDEVAYLYPARYFARGLLTLPLPSVPAAFELDLMTYEATRWYSPVPPGWPAVLAVGALFGAAWLVNPVLNALNIIFAYVLLRSVYDRRTARIAVLLLATSPWFLFMGMNFMTHTLALTCALVGGIAVARLRQGASVAWTVAGGLAIGMIGLNRPLEGLTIAVLLGFWSLGGWPWSAARIARTGLLALFALIAGAVALPYNKHLSGESLTFPLMAYTDSVYGVGKNALGFGANRGLGWPGLDPFPGHGIIDVLVNGNLNTYSVNTELLGWSIGSLLPLLLLLAARRMTRADVWMVLVISAIVGVHSFYWFSGGPDFGARYWYLIIVPCIALTARAVQVVADGLAESRRVPGAAPAPAPDAASARSRVVFGVLALSLVAIVTFVPWRALDKYYHYRNMRPDVRRIAAEQQFGRSLVLVRGRRHPDYASAAIYNPLDLRANAPIYVWDRDDAITGDALRAYSHRPVWIIDGPTRTGAGFRVVGGPYSADEVLAGAAPPR